ncbi:MAG TPA: hypothetical protein VKM36_02070, partial [Balneolaceae bacterium]|nr:hypothetical protein [Balneolaceae bacterium]
DTIVMIQGEINRRDAQPKIIAKSMERVENLREKFQSKLSLQLQLDTGDLTGDELQNIATLFSLHKGETSVKFYIKSNGTGESLTMNVRKFVVEPNNELLNSLRGIVGNDSVALVKN